MNPKEASSQEAASILEQAHRYLIADGIRPYWTLQPFTKGEDVPASQAPDVVARLITCESQGHSVKVVDSNGYYSYGVLQFQSSTWAQLTALSGLSGDPMQATDAIPVGIWAVEHGFAYKWTCSKLLKIVI